MQLSLSQLLWFVLAMAAILSLGISVIYKMIRKHSARKPDAMKTLRILPHRDTKIRGVNDLTAGRKLQTTH